MRALLLLSALLLVACDGADPGPTDSGPDGGTDGGTDGGSDAGSDSGSDAGSDSGTNDSGSELDAGEPTPILERTPAATYTCTVARDMIAAELAGEYGVRPATAVTPSGAFFSARTTIEPSLLIAPVDPNGTVGAPLIRIEAQSSDLHRPSLVADVDGFAVAWIEDNRVRFARYDAAGAEVVAPRVVGTAPTLPINAVELARADGGFGISFIELGFDRSLRAAVHFIGVDTAGAVTGEATLENIQNDVQFFGGRIAGFGSEYAVLYERTGATFGEIFFATIDQAGTIAGPTRIQRFEGRGAFSYVSPSLSMERFDGSWILVWVEDFYSEEDLHSVLRLARVDDDGNVLTPPTLLRRAELDIDEVEPRLLRFNGMIALLWSRGASSRTCGICTAGHSLQSVLLDPETWVPASNVLDLPSTIQGERGQYGGVLGNAPVTFGTDILAAFLIRYHTESVPASALIRCVD
jgi:hypothetical protein